MKKILLMFLTSVMTLALVLSIQLERQEVYAVGGTAFVANDVLPATTDLKIAWTTELADWDAAFVEYDFFVMTEAQYFVFGTYSFLPLSSNGTYLLSLDSGDYVRYGINSSMTDLYNWTTGYISSCGVDNDASCSTNEYFMLDTSSWTLSQRTIDSIQTEVTTYGLTWEDLNVSRTVTYDSNGGSSVSPEEVDDDDYATEPSDPTRTGYTFNGWFTDEGTWSDEWAFTTDAVTADITLHAKWTILTYSVAFNSNGGSSVTTQTIDHGSTVSEPNDPTKTGHTFVDWYTESALTNVFSFATTITAARTLYAKWSINEYTITFNSQGGSAVTAITDDYGAAVSAPASPTKADNQFYEWTTDSGGETPYTFTTMPAGNLTLYAQWKRLWDVTFASDGGSAVDPIYDVVAGSLIDEPDEPTKSGYTFSHWYWDDGYDFYEWDFAINTVAQDEILSAFWTANEYTITFDTNSGSAIDPITQACGTDVSAPDDPTRTGHTFAGWYADVELATTYVFTTIPAADITIYAKWTVNTYTITFDSNEGSDVAPAVYDYAEETTEPDDPERESLTFAGWYSDEALTIPYVFTTMPDADITLYAKWVLYQEVPTPPATTDWGALFLQYWWVIAVAIGGVVILSTLFSTKPKRRRYRRRY